MAAAFARTSSQRIPQLVSIVGNQGTGKSRLAAEFAAGLPPPTRVFEGRATQARYSAIARLLRHRFALEEGADPELSRQRIAKAVQEVFGDRRVGDVVHFLGSFLGLRFADSPLSGAFEDQPRQHDEVARAVFRRFLAMDAAAAPLVLVLDDLDCADDDTLSLLDDLGEGLKDVPVLILACARPELGMRHPRWPKSWNGEATLRLELGNLAEGEAAALLSSLLSRCDHVPADLLYDAVNMTGGNPFFLEELVRVFLANGTIDARGARWHLDLRRAAETELPLSVEEAIEARIAALSPAERELLEKGAILGNVFWLSSIVALSRAEKRCLLPPQGVPLEAPARWIDDKLHADVEALLLALVERDYLLVLPPEDSTVPKDVEVVFKHNLERELVSKLTPADRRAFYHRIAAQWWESKLGQRSEADLELVAELYERGGEASQAARRYLAAGDRARDRFANEQAVDYFERGLRLLAPDDALARIEALHNLGDVLARIGRTDEAEGRFRTMLELAWLLDYPAKGGAAHGRLGRLCRQRAELKQALSHFQAAHALFGRAGDARGVAGAEGDLGSVFAMVGDYRAALARHQQALALRRAQGDKRSIALSLASLGQIYHHQGVFQAALEHFREAMELRRDIGDRPGVIASLCDLGSVHRAAMRLDKACEAYLEALRQARDIGDRLAQSEVLLRLGEVELERAAVHASADYIAQAEEIVVALGDRLGQAESARTSAEVFLALGDGPRAMALAERALLLAHQVGSRVHLGMAERTLAEVTSRNPTDEGRRIAEEHFLAAIQILASMKHELELARAYRAFSAFAERTGRASLAADLRRRADEVFVRVPGAQQGSS
jgi:tetratricopeptide (TPR) repeat protein